MATRVNIMKLLQEMRGLADITSRNPQTRQPGPLVLPLRFSSRKNPAKLRRTLRIAAHNPPDIPDPVRITHLRSAPQLGAAPTP